MSRHPPDVGPRGYPLGTDEAELARLAFQHEVWGGATRELLERAGLAAGQRCLDLGAGPGFVTEELAARVGPEGRVLAVDESPRWFERLEALAARHPWIEARRARVQELALEAGSLDLALARWVVSFLDDPGAELARVARALRPGGALVLQDYNHEGISVFPHSPGFEAVVAATRALYRKVGGDLFVAGRFPALCAEAGLELEALEPRVLCGGPDSPAFRWADAFFPHHAAGMVERGLLAAADRERFLAEWAERRADPTAIFFSPIVVGCVARRPG